MKKICLVVMLFVLSNSFAFASSETLYETFKSKKEVAVFIGDLTDATKAHEVNLADLKTKLESEFTNRKSIHFKVVSSKSEADIVVEGAVKDFFWAPTDPVDMIMGVGMVAMDAVNQEPYARIEADLKITDKNDQVLWADKKVTATLTQAGMTHEKSTTMINDRLATVLVKRAFGKKKSS